MKTLREYLKEDILNEAGIKSFDFENNPARKLIEINNEIMFYKGFYNDLINHFRGEDNLYDYNYIMVQKETGLKLKIKEYSMVVISEVILDNYKRSRDIGMKPVDVVENKDITNKEITSLVLNFFKKKKKEINDLKIKLREKIKELKSEMFSVYKKSGYDFEFYRSIMKLKPANYEFDFIMAMFMKNYQSKPKFYEFIEGGDKSSFYEYVKGEEIEEMKKDPYFYLEILGEKDTIMFFYENITNFIYALESELENNTIKSNKKSKVLNGLEAIDYGGYAIGIFTGKHHDPEHYATEYFKEIKNLNLDIIEDILKKQKNNNI